LTIPAFLGDITPQNIKQALESVHQQDVNDWIEQSIGESDSSKRRKAFAKTE
jgi:phosphoribosylanthranilate isomerase